MSKTTDALEVAVSEIRAIHAECGEAAPTARQRRAIDRHFAEVLRLIAPRIRHFIKQYGLVDHWEDAEQVCAIAVHRSIAAYDPEKARFTTFINWQLRGELQGLRFRLRADQRSSAKKVGAVTISFDMLDFHDGDERIPFESMIEDEEAEARTESMAALHLARNTAMGMIDDYIDHLRSLGTRQLASRVRPAKPARRNTADPLLPAYVQVKPGTIDPRELERMEARLLRDRRIMERHLMGDDDLPDDDAAIGGLTSEQIRQITRRATRNMVDRVMASERFNPDFASEPTEGLPSASPYPAASILPDRGNPAAAFVSVRDGSAALPEADPVIIPDMAGLRSRKGGVAGVHLPMPSTRKH